MCPMIQLNQRALRFERCFLLDCSRERQSRSGGLCMLWREHVDLSLISYSRNHLSFGVESEGDDQRWQISGIYGWPEQNKWHMTWQLMR
ncbi:hypothetical protein ACS0TY_007940 [Phlomoides rotata]